MTDPELADEHILSQSQLRWYLDYKKEGGRCNSPKQWGGRLS